MGKLSLIVASVAIPMGGLSYLLRKRAPLVITGGLAQGSAVGTLVAICSSDFFAQHTTSLLGKRKADGHFKFWSIPIFWPYFLGLQIKLRIQRMFSTEPLYTEVAPGIFIGGWPDAPASLPGGNATSLAVIDCTSELYRTHFEAAYLCLPTWDTAGVAPIHVAEGVEFAVKELSAGKKLFVHCAHGHGRSATVLAAVLLETGLARSIDEAVALMKRKRPLVKLNRSQRKSVEDWLTMRQRRGAGTKGAVDSVDVDRGGEIAHTQGHGAQGTWGPHRDL